jgi:hypothetical protein
MAYVMPSNDGKVILMPDEHEVNVGSDANDNLFVPAYPSQIGWLPCGTNALKQSVAIRDPADRFSEMWQEPVFPSPQDVLPQERIYYVTDGERKYPRYGISIEAISKFLRYKKPKLEDFDCFEE